MKYSNMAITVTDLNKYVKDKFEEDEYLNNVLIKGEISNFKRHYTGHLYFTLKDENSLVKCIMFKGNTARLNFEPQDGNQVIILGSVSVFERDGVYQIYVRAMEQDGLGNLYAEYEKLKSKLEEQGMFDESHKKKIPLMPKIVGVLTSQTGSVIKDIINVSTRRNPNVYIRLFPVPVQGKGAAEKIAYGIRLMNEKKLADVIIIARGGGSLEDLWPFNEEIVANAIYESELPVISAVGHETDFTIADFVSDLRAPTPSAAAELAVPDIYELKQKINTYSNRIRISLKKKVELMRLQFEKIMNSNVFKEPYRKINDRSLILDTYVKRMENVLNNKIKISKTVWLEQTTKLDTLSPLKTLTRGYVIAQKDNKVMRSIKEIKKDDEIELKFIDGNAKAKVI